MDLAAKEATEDLGEVGEGETTMRIYFVRKIHFQLKKKIHFYKGLVIGNIYKTSKQMKKQATEEPPMFHCFKIKTKHLWHSLQFSSIYALFT